MQNNSLITKKFVSTVVKTVLISVILNLIILVIARSTTGVPATFGPFMYWPVISFTALGVLGAGVVYIVIKKISRNHNHIFKIVSYITLALSFIPDLQLPASTHADDAGATTLVVGILILMHIVTALVVIYSFTKKRINQGN